MLWLERVKQHYLYSENGRWRHRSAQYHIKNLLLNQEMNTGLLRARPVSTSLSFFSDNIFISSSALFKILLPIIAPSVSGQWGNLGIWMSYFRCILDFYICSCGFLHSYSCKSNCEKLTIFNIWYNLH